MKNVFRLRNLLLVLALLIAIILAIMIWVRRQPEDVLRIAAKTLPKGVDLALKGIDYTHIEGGINRWRLQAEQVQHEPAKEQLLLQKPRLDFFDLKGVLKNKLKADRGTVSQDYQHVTVSGDVVLEDSRGYTFFTQSLRYDHDQQLISTNETVKLVGDGVKLTGKGLNLNLATRRLTVLAKVRATLNPKEFK